MENNDNPDDDKANDKSGKKKKFVDLGPRARLLQILLSAAIFMRLFDLCFGLIVFAFPQLVNSDFCSLLIGLITYGTPLATIPAGIALLIWMGQAFTNLQAMKIKTLGRKSIQCYWGWIIPFANIVIPVSTMQDIWKASDPSEMDQKRWRLLKSSLLISTWWATYLLAGALGVAQRLQMNADPMVQFTVGIGLDIMFCVAFLQLIFIVRDIGARQQSKKALLETPDSVSSA